MKAVLDTNVVISGIFFGGAPGGVLAAWARGEFTVVGSPQILEEYRRVAAELAAQFPAIELTRILDLLTIHAEIIEDRESGVPSFCRDPDDEKFLVCAAAGDALLVTGGQGPADNRWRDGRPRRDPAQVHINAARRERRVAIGRDTRPCRIIYFKFSGFSGFRSSVRKIPSFRTHCPSNHISPPP